MYNMYIIGMYACIYGVLLVGNAIHFSFCFLSICGVPKCAPLYYIVPQSSTLSPIAISFINSVFVSNIMRKILAIIGALITGAIGIAAVSTAQQASASLTSN